MTVARWLAGCLLFTGPELWNYEQNGLAWSSEIAFGRSAMMIDDRDSTPERLI